VKAAPLNYSEKGENMSKDKRTIGDNQNPIQDLSHKAYDRLKDKIADSIDFSLRLLQDDLAQAENGRRLFDRNKAIINAQESVENLREHIRPIKNCFKKMSKEEWEYNLKELPPECADYERALSEVDNDKK
tara:strand:- start:193 stop:585 length:393 start_codon:yes stop_codon:yes gene_type:complete